MKVSGLLAVLVLVAACGGEERDEVAVIDDTAGVRARLESAPEATSGEAPAKPAPARPAGATPSADARAASRGSATVAAVESGVNTDAAVLKDFNDRVAAYAKLHRSLAKGDAKLRETEDPARITEAKAMLAERIRAARPHAKQGDIFTAEIRHKFRRLLAPELKGEDGRDAKEILKDDAPAPGAIPFTVNAKYPESQPLPTVPANLLLNMPTLPEPLEYRVVGKHLILLDTAADLLVVDYIPNAIK